MPQHISSKLSTSRFSAQNISILALLSAIAAVCTLFFSFPILPSASYLKLDIAVAIATMAGLSLGLYAAAIVSILPNLLHIATASGIYGAFMAIAASLAFSLSYCALQKGSSKPIRSIIASLIATLAMTLVMLAFNLIVTPAYTGMPQAAVIGLFLPVLIPFNLIKGLLCSLICSGWTLLKQAKH